MANGDFKAKHGMSIGFMLLIPLLSFAGAFLANFLTKHVLVDQTGKFIAEIKPRINTSNQTQS